MDRSLTTVGAAPEVGTLDSRSLARLRWLGNLLDNSIQVPGTNFRFGLDTIIGLVPGVGDLAGGALSLYIIVEAARMGCPATAARRWATVAVDALVGAVPVLGDLFDAGFKANLRNLALVQQHVDRPVASQTSSRRFTAVLAIGVLLLLAAGVALGILVVRLLDRPVL